MAEYMLYAYVCTVVQAIEGTWLSEPYGEIAKQPHLCPEIMLWSIVVGGVVKLP